MTKILGMDTGGTYTDGVIMERETKRIIASAKALTTHEDLIVGIRNVLDRFDETALRDVDYVALSTTLATNAIVEKNGCRVGLLLLGSDVTDDLPDCELRQIDGAIGVAGNEEVPLDEEKARLAAASLKGKVDAVAISGIFSIRDPRHENRAKAIVGEILDLPVIMAHELTGTIGIRERTNTAVLNAKLIPVIAELMTAVKRALAEKEMGCPLMIVKGDGSLMNEKVALERPIETILSGPAASIIGTTFLNDIRDGIVCDMGGTTTDLAILAKGKPRLTKEGADVGGWRTRVSAVNAYTFGLGGDSYFSRDAFSHQWQVGPRRSRPIAVVAAEYPHYKEELVRRRGRVAGLVHFGQADGLQLLKQPDDGFRLSDIQRQIIAGLEDGPHTVIGLGKKIGVDPNYFFVDRLIEQGILGLVGFTPTDALCATDRCDLGDGEASRLAATLIAAERGSSTEDFYALCFDKVKEKMCRSLLTCVLEEDGVSGGGDTLAEYYFQNAIGRAEHGYFRATFHIDAPVVGIGAPIAAWLPPATAALAAETVISAHHEVANAVGAAAGEVMTIYSLLVRNHRGEKLTVFAPWGKTDFFREEPDDPEEVVLLEDMVDDVVAFAIDEGKQHLRANMAAQGIADYEILVEREDAKVEYTYSENVDLFIESKIDVIAVGLPFAGGEDEKEEQL